MKKVFFILLSVFTLVSCKKDKGETACMATAASIAGSYRITAITYKASATSAEMNYYNLVFPDACERDDILSLNINGTYIMIDAGIVCSPPNTDNGNWSISGNTLIIDGDPSTIESYNCQTLILIQTGVQVAGDKYKITLTRQ
ncbi:MAG: lipocalin family protein [Ferruginibacter sp.]